MELNDLIKKIIPPADYAHRNGFNNDPYIDELTKVERRLVEDALIEMLTNKHDMLIVETLAYMKSTKSLPTLNTLLSNCTESVQQLIIAKSIFEINGNRELINVARDAFLRLKDNYSKTSAFYYLSKFKDSGLNELIKKYIDDPDFLLSYNARRYLGLDISQKWMKERRVKE